MKIHETIALRANQEVAIVFNFIKRQIGTKTGKLGMGLVLGSLANSYLPADMGGMVRDFVSPLLGAEGGTLGLLGMFLRDGAAKKGE